MVAEVIGENREYLMYYKGPGFLYVVLFGSLPLPSLLSRQQIVSLAQSLCVLPVELTEGIGKREEPNHTSAA
jgi:hypothetical protein